MIGLERDTAGVLAPPPLLFALPLLVGLAFSWWRPAPFVPAATRWPMGIILVVAALGLLAWAESAMRAAKTSPIPWRPTTAITARGPYRYSRNPMYLGMAVAYVGIAILADSLWALGLLPVALALVHFGAVVREERYLDRKFGDDYDAYRSRVRRWL